MLWLLAAIVGLVDDWATWIVAILAYVAGNAVASK